MKKIKVAVLMGGKSPEHEVSLASGREVARHLNPKKYEVLPVVVSRDGLRWEVVEKEKLLHSPAGIGKTGSSKFKVKSSKLMIAENQNLLIERGVGGVDLVFIAMHGPHGEDGEIQGMLETLGLPYTGSGVLASALGMDKIASRKIFEREKIPVPRYLIFQNGQTIDVIWEFFGKPPLFVKPHHQGSSVGGSVVHRKNDLNQALKLALSYSNPILVEEYLEGIEVSGGVLGNEEPYALPVAEIVPKNEFFDYEAKYTPGKSEEIVPARISKSETLKVQEVAVKVFKAVGARGFARVDIIINDGKPVVLEINTIPGLTPVSILPKEAAAAGISYSQLLDKIIEFALGRKDTPGVFSRYR